MRANPTAASTTNHSDENSRVNHSVRRIRALADALNARCYLEIGVAKGVTFNSLTLPEKTAVDPRFAFDIAPYEKPGVSFEQLPSDDFFSRLPRSQKFDIIFIDGLHEFEQTYRDFCNALSHASDSTVIIIDDTKPSDVFSAIPEFRASISARKAAGLPGAPWHGDVFKVVFALHDFHPTYNYRTIGGSGNPQTLVWKSNQGWRKPIFNSFERISRLSYFDLQTHIEILRECGEEEALSLCLAEIRASQIE